MPDRLTHRRTKGARLPEGARLVTRATRWGNPFRVGDLLGAGGGDWSHPFPDRLWDAQFAYLQTGPLGHTAAAEAYRALRLRLATLHVVALFRALAEHFRATDPAGFDAWIAPLRGHDLACSCAPGEPCHADVLIELCGTR